jgi:NAD-dependent DNA ligase
VKKFVDEAEACRPAMPYLYDGVVVSYLDPTIRKTLGRNNHINQYSIAIKFNTKKKLTRCRGVSFTIGANGDITPMIHYDPIEFYGAINTKSSLHSYSRFRELGLKPNDIIEVEYVNDVMAYVSKAQVEENMYNPLRPFEFMRQCPECGRPIVISESGDNATCTNMACPGRTVARVTNMLSKLGFKGFSEAAVRSLNLTSFKDLMTLQEDRAAVLGPTNQKTLIAAIEKLYESNVPDFMLLGSLGFTNIASGKWKAILKKIPLADIITASDVELMFKIDSSGKGIGEKTARTIVTERKFFMKDLEYIYRMPNVVITRGDNTRDITFSKVIRFSGVRDSDLMNQLTFDGHDCSEGAVTKNTDYLIIPFIGYTSGKVAKAEEYNAKSTSHKIKILTLDEFKLNMSTYLMS